YQITAQTRALSSIKLEVPVIPSTFYCVGLNYADHIVKMAAKKGIEPSFPQQPDVGYRTVNALIAHGETVIMPPDSSEIQYEGELVVVIGKRTKNVSKEEALNCVFGFTIGNDVSERVWQKSDRTLWRAKNTDTFKPMGPWIETDVDLDQLETRVSVNRNEQVTFPTNNMLFGVETYISTISKYATLYPGDVLWMGTDGIPSNLESGDVVDIEISGIGTLSNPFQKE
ncbi:fumarylacetoacetate hydrolase family protein, partial [Pseudomonadota bacterium]